MMPTRDTMPLTKNPFRIFTVQVHISSQFSHHLVETLDRIRYAVHRFKTFAYSPVDRDPGKCKLESNSVSIPRRVPEQKKILTLAAATKASFHELLTNAALAHSLKSGVAVGELRVAWGLSTLSCPAAFEAAPPSLPRAEKYRRVKSDGKA